MREEELSKHWDRLFGEIARVDHKIDGLGLALSARLDALDQKLDRKIDAVRSDLARQFRWTIGVMVALATGVLTAALTR